MRVLRAGSVAGPVGQAPGDRRLTHAAWCRVALPSRSVACTRVRAGVRVELELGCTRALADGAADEAALVPPLLGRIRGAAA